MGCSNTREGKPISWLSTECDTLMQKNLDLFSIIICLLIGKNRTSAALSILSLRKRTEDYYVVIRRYRFFWISRAKKTMENETSTVEVERCEHEQTLEKSQLFSCNSLLQKKVENLRPEWNAETQTIKELLESLEQQPHIAQICTSLYENYYGMSKKHIKAGILECNSPLSDEEKKLFNSIKESTVKFYKVPEKRVYFTEEILVKAKKAKSKITIDEKESIKNTEELEKSMDRVASEIMSKSSKSKSRRNTYENNHEQISIEESSESDEEEMELRLSISQK